MGKGVKAGDAHVQMHMDGKGIGASVSAIGGKFGKLAALAGQAAAAITGIGAAAGMAVKHFAATGDALDKMAARTGISVESLSQLQFAAEQSGANLETFEAALRGMTNQIGSLASGSTEAQSVFKRLGIEFGDLASLNPEQQFELIAERIADIKNPTERAAVAMKIFGEQGSLLLPMMISDMQALRDESDKLGHTMSTEQAAAAAELNDAWNKLKKSAGGLSMALGATLAPVLTRILDLFARILGRMSQWMASIRGLKQEAKALEDEKPTTPHRAAPVPAKTGKVPPLKDIDRSKEYDPNAGAAAPDPGWTVRNMSRGGFGRFFDPGERTQKQQLDELRRLNVNMERLGQRFGMVFK